MKRTCTLKITWNTWPGMKTHELSRHISRGCGRGDVFYELAKETTRKKPIVVMKSGTTAPRHKPPNLTPERYPGLTIFIQQLSSRPVSSG